MEASAFKSALGAFDVVLLTDLLLGSDLPDWCALETTSKAFHRSVDQVKPHLKRKVASSVAGESILELSRQANLTGLWAVLPDSGDKLDAADVRHYDLNSDSSVMHAVATNTSDRSSLCLSWLLAQPGMHAFAAKTNCKGESPLHFCAKYGEHKQARQLVACSNVQVDAVDNYGATPLIVAVRAESVEMVQLLREAGADVNRFVELAHCDGETPFILAVRLKNEAIVQELLAAPELNPYMKSMSGVPFAREALDFAIPGSRLHRIISKAIVCRGWNDRSADANTEYAYKPTCVWQGSDRRVARATAGCKPGRIREALATGMPAMPRRRTHAVAFAASFFWPGCMVNSMQ
eukprot:TRINITY_DN76150_c0_g1_i1.p1 TRINITY_DN76150_c0_g1~~TRINITY_DN76150_c0_g1_i1.p1  ORF type:complete len:349 (-),score=33.38 TRINITY_DN76150_c0_g1_i1:238-1284(-)